MVDIPAFIPDKDGWTTSLNPFGAFAQPNSQKTAEAHIEGKLLFLASFFPDRTFQGMCRRLGGRAPSRESTQYFVPPEARESLEYQNVSPSPAHATDL